MAFAKRCGGPMMVEFCFHNWDRLRAIVEKSWKVQQVEGFITFQTKTRWQVLQDALSSACTCEGAWAGYAQRILQQNDIPVAAWCQAMTAALQGGRAKGNLVRHAVLHGNESKGLEKARLALLDDWRFNEDVTTLSADLTELKGKKFLQQGDVEMMLKRLLVFNFTKPIVIPKPVVQGCGHCFASLLLEEAESRSVADVVSFLHHLSLSHLAPKFEENGVDGQMLCELSLEDLIDNLGL
ncbi:SAM domain-containing protein (Fragment), partial [Durusdinium trenchii]